jgi:hypothetical protein
MSINTTSGLVSTVLARASAPVPASATTSMSGSPVSIVRIPARTSAWSSASNTRITALT